MKDVLTSQLQEQLRISFERNLVTAVAYGQRPDSSAGFGPHTISAIEAIAREHPEAAVRLIAEAHDAFFLEHVSASAALGCSVSFRVAYSHFSLHPKRIGRDRPGQSIVANRTL
jgi:hypothetical protein